jgi:hypothetical protein
MVLHQCPPRMLCHNRVNFLNVCCRPAPCSTWHRLLSGLCQRCSSCTWERRLGSSRLAAAVAAAAAAAAAATCQEEAIRPAPKLPAPPASRPTQSLVSCDWELGSPIVVLLLVLPCGNWRGLCSDPLPQEESHSRSLAQCAPRLHLADTYIHAATATMPFTHAGVQQQLQELQHMLQAPSGLGGGPQGGRGSSRGGAKASQGPSSSPAGAIAQPGVRLGVFEHAHHGCR